MGCFEPPAPTPAVVCSADLSGVGLALCCFVVLFCGVICFMSVLCYFVLVFFGPFGVAVASLVEGVGRGTGGKRGGTGLGAFRVFVRLALVWFCLFPLPLGVWEGLRFLIVALPWSFLLLFSVLIICSVSAKQI